MSAGPEMRFIADRMLGTLTRYLRFMGYDTLSANGLAAGNGHEDSLLLDMASMEGRILLTRDRELAVRGGRQAVLITAEGVAEQISQLVDRGLIIRRVRMTRCSLCNTVLRTATAEEIAGAGYAPCRNAGLTFFWCDRCRRLYWDGSHGKRIAALIGGTGGKGDQR